MGRTRQVVAAYLDFGGSVIHTRKAPTWLRKNPRRYGLPVAAPSGGSRYKPTKSTTFSANAGFPRTLSSAPAATSVSSAPAASRPLRAPVGLSLTHILGTILSLLASNFYEFKEELAVLL